ncbi:hypothetical protein SAMN02745136_03202 [Anaerocolumna jejuensis DSM 15929]|uniref:Uncharacterized protein n=1 Tax=Anaerocolumna jejuensis DSM 15929 TaxID=1121322 RepID=A0A1M6UV96_9FIRM|nr:hypothetical protein [Anaerocolumna jejuensis]SHK73160.1 hypothetical protein SAMN02745136_03202 [Anaerocolumna jejuensis DSM 15929]
MSQDKKVKRKLFFNSAIGLLQIMAGGFFAFIFGITLLGCFFTMFGPKKTTTVGETLVILIIFVLFTYMLLRGFRRRRLNKIYYVYTQQLMKNSAFSIEQLAAALRMPLDSVRKDMEEMVKKELIDIDDNNYNQYYQDYEAEEPTYASDTKSNIRKPASEMISDEYFEVTCKNCGASSKVLKGSAVICEYCGSMLKSE